MLGNDLDSDWFDEGVPKANPLPFRALKNQLYRNKLKNHQIKEIDCIYIGLINLRWVTGLIE